MPMPYRILFILFIALNINICMQCRGDTRPDGPLADVFVYMHDAKVYQATFDRGQIQTIPISRPDEIVCNFTVSSGKCVILLKTDKHGEQAISTTKRGRLNVTTIDLIHFPQINSETSMDCYDDTIAFIQKENDLYSLRVLDIKKNQTRSLFEQKEILLSPAWSPDGKWIAFYAANLTGDICLRIVNVTSGQSKQLAGPSNATRFGGPAREMPLWFNDGRKIYFEAAYKNELGSMLYEVDVSGNDTPIRFGAGLCTAIDVKQNVAYVVKGGIYAIKIAQPQEPPKFIAKGWWPRISHSGRFLCYYRSNAIYMQDLISGVESPVLDQYKGDGKNTAWAIDNE